LSDAKPSDLALAIYDLGDLVELSTDTETSGLFADDGARVSTASIAWIDEIGLWREWAERWDNITYGVETIADGLEVAIVSTAWPFDQGTEGKPEDTGQIKLWPDAANLDQEEWEFLLRILVDHDLNMHNGKFDCEKYRVGCRRWPGVGVELINNLVWDTQNVNDLLWRLHPTSLKPTCARLFGQEWADESQVVKKYLQRSKLPTGRWDLMPWAAIGKYADTDARITLMLKLRQIWEIENNHAGDWLYRDAKNCSELDDMQMVYDKIERRLVTTRVLYRMERRGVPYDEVTSRLAADECRDRAAPIEKGLPFEPTRERAVKYFFEEGKTDKGIECLDLVPYSVTDKGTPQLTAEILARMEDDRVPYAKEWGEWSRVSNAASMWYEGYADAVGTDGRIRTAFRQNGTRSTRFSVERLNLQAIPQDYRLSDHKILDGIITPRGLIANAVPDGWRLYELDLAQAELRVGAMHSKCKLMIEMIMDNADLHTFTTKYLFPDIPETNPLFKSKWRQVGKRGNFSLGFGSKGKTFKAMVSKECGVQLSDTESDRIVRDWNALYPEWQQAIWRHQNVVARRQAKFGYGWLGLINGERRWFQEYEEAHKAFNQRVQGNLAQFGMDWMLMTDAFLRDQHELHQWAEKDKVGEVGLVLTIHDSQVLMLPDNEFGRGLADRCARFGKDLWKQMFPKIPGDVDFHLWDRVE
jgi:DNA polymerase I-like protein with 3'-5' exonuclease and polymerase domains